MYTVITIVCLIFSRIYSYFSFGVHSVFMTYLSLIPLVLGIVVNIFAICFKKLKYSKITMNMYDAGVITLIFGSGVKGILDICGAHSYFIFIYWIIGITFITIGLIELIRYNIKNR